MRRHLQSSSVTYSRSCLYHLWHQYLWVLAYSFFSSGLASMSDQNRHHYKFKFTRLPKDLPFTFPSRKTIFLGAKWTGTVCIYSSDHSEKWTKSVCIHHGCIQRTFLFFICCTFKKIIMQ
ncbi:hypothetical protein NP493_457g01050 [Ridgeia piscesae]|uniref:Uncharacterized protein n=1 Tax=Ridgeia piscesae TaxID=27915 RepID=A0AAD9NRU8_RIDPI|nr:hypothetical protein NP493_457g01050 [Ridgeia piscesae]